MGTIEIEENKWKWNDHIYACIAGKERESYRRAALYLPFSVTRFLWSGMVSSCVGSFKISSLIVLRKKDYSSIERERNSLRGSLKMWVEIRGNPSYRAERETCKHSDKR